MPNIPATIRIDNSEILLGLSITTPTGKIRVKRKNNPFDFGIPTATRQTEIDENCYIEWQIGYDTPNINEEGVVVEEIQYLRNGVLKFGYELTSIFWIGLKNNIFKREILEELLTFAESIKDDEFIEENSSITRFTVSEKRFQDLCFHIIEEKYPVYLLEKDEYQIDVVVRHKQRAVGYQSMIYVWLPIKNAEEKILGRSANQKEVLHFRINEFKNNFIFDTFKTFSIASKQHNEDMKNILKTIKCKI